MGDMAQWNLEVPRELDEDVRSLLAGDRTDLAAFVREAVEAAMLDRMFAAGHERNADLAEDAATGLANEAVRFVRNGRSAAA